MHHLDKSDRQVFERVSRFFRGLDGRVKVTIAGTAIQNYGQQLTMQYTQLYASNLGADAVEIGFLNSITGAVNTIVSVPQGWATERYTVKKIMLLGLACAALSAAFSALANDWWMLIPAFILAGRLVMIMPLADIIFISITNPQRRATIMSLARVIWDMLGTFSPMAAALVVASFGGINAQGIRPLYYIQILLATFVFLLVAVKLEPLSSEAERKTAESSSRKISFIQDFRELFEGEKWLKRWILLGAVRAFGMSLAMPFAPLWMVDVKGATPYILGVMGAASAIMSSFLQVPAGRLADRVGRKKVYFLLRPLAYLGTVLLIFAPSPEYLIVVGFLGSLAVGGGVSGGIGGVSFTPFITMHWEMIPREKRGRRFGIEGLCMSASAIPATILGGILWQHGLMREVLLLPLVLEALVVTPILVTVPDTLTRPRQ